MIRLASSDSSIMDGSSSTDALLKHHECQERLPGDGAGDEDRDTAEKPDSASWRRRSTSEDDGYCSTSSTSMSRPKRRRWTGALSFRLCVGIVVLALLVIWSIASSDDQDRRKSRDDGYSGDSREPSSMLKYAQQKGASLLGLHSSGPSLEASASQLPPSLSTLPERLKRITLIAIWNNDDRPFYLQNYLRSASLNADVADLLIVHMTERSATATEGGLSARAGANNNNKDQLGDGARDYPRCLDGRFGNDNITRDAAAWDWQNGGNIKVVCLDREELLQVEAEMLCAQGTGWGCNTTQFDAVHTRLRERDDYISNDWKPMRGEMFRRFFIHPENPMWAWTDMDMHLGRLDHLPFPLLSTVAIVAPHYFTPSLLFLPGQMTLFNMDYPGFVGAWKQYAPLVSPEQFCKKLRPEDGGYGEGAIDESWLSAAYLRHTEGYAGQGLSWVAIPDVHGQDIFIPGRKFVVSGRNVLEVDSSLTRIEIEEIVKIASSEPVHQTAGWTRQGRPVEMPMLLGKQCKTFWFDEHAAQCVSQTNLTRGDQYTRVDSVHRGTVLRIAGDEPNTLQMRLEPDARPRRWQRKLFLHYQEIKRQDWWWTLPSDYFLGDDGEVMEFDWKDQYVWRMGDDRREVNIWERHNGRLSSDGSSAHTQGVKVPRAGRRSLTAASPVPL